MLFRSVMSLQGSTPYQKVNSRTSIGATQIVQPSLSARADARNDHLWALQQFASGSTDSPLHVNHNSSLHCNTGLPGYSSSTVMPMPWYLYDHWDTDSTSMPFTSYSITLPRGSVGEGTCLTEIHAALFIRPLNGTGTWGNVRIVVLLYDEGETVTVEHLLEHGLMANVNTIEQLPNICSNRYILYDNQVSVFMGATSVSIDLTHELYESSAIYKNGMRTRVAFIVIPDGSSTGIPADYTQPIAPTFGVTCIGSVRASGTYSVDK